jgi:hypothetical protein
MGKRFSRRSLSGDSARAEAWPNIGTRTPLTRLAEGEVQHLSLWRRRPPKSASQDAGGSAPLTTKVPFTGTSCCTEQAVNSCLACPPSFCRGRPLREKSSSVHLSTPLKMTDADLMLLGLFPPLGKFLIVYPSDVTGSRLPAVARFTGRRRDRPFQVIPSLVFLRLRSQRTLPPLRMTISSLFEQRLCLVCVDIFVPHRRPSERLKRPI